MTRWLLCALLWLTPGVAAADEAAALLERLPCGPTIQQTQRAALRAWGLDGATSYGSRARLAALLPQVEVQAGWRGQTLEEERFREDMFFDPEARSLVMDGAQSVGRGQAEDMREVSVKVRLELGRLVFDPRELQAAREERAAAAQRERLLRQVTQLYYARRQSQAALLWLAPGQVERRLELMLAIERDGALLDALTDGWFGRQAQEAR